MHGQRLELVDLPDADLDGEPGNRPAQPESSTTKLDAGAEAIGIGAGAQQAELELAVPVRAAVAEVDDLARGAFEDQIGVAVAVEVGRDHVHPRTGADGADGGGAARNRESAFADIAP